MRRLLAVSPILGTAALLLVVPAALPSARTVGASGVLAVAAANPSSYTFTLTNTSTSGERIMCWRIVFTTRDVPSQTVAPFGWVALPLDGFLGVGGQSQSGLAPGSSASFSLTMTQPLAAGSYSLAVSATCQAGSDVAGQINPDPSAAPQPPPLPPQPAPSPPPLRPQRAPLPPKAGMPVRVNLPVPVAGEIAGGLLEVPLTRAQQKADGKPDAAIRIAVEHPGSLPSGVSIEAAAKEVRGKLLLSFLIPHVLPPGGTAPAAKFTFDTTLFSTYTGALWRPGPTATLDVYLFDTTKSAPTDRPVCSPCSFYLFERNTRKQLLRVDDLISGKGAFDASVKLGFGVMVISGGEPDGVDLQGFVVGTSKSEPFDVSVFGFEPPELRPPGTATQGVVDLLAGKSTPQAAALVAAVRG